MIDENSPNPNHSALDLGTEAENREIFDDWFQDLVFQQTSALLRRVLNENKEAMWATWLRVRPYGFEDTDG